MKLALTVWQGRIAPVFDVSREADVLTVRGGCVIESGHASIAEPTAQGRIDRLTVLGVDTLICGAISEPLHNELGSRGIRVFAFLAGEADAIVDAFLKGRLTDPAWAMPGCFGGRLRRRTRCRRRCSLAVGLDE